MFDTMAKMEQENRVRNDRNDTNEKVESISKRVDETDDKLYDIKTVLSDVSSNIRKISKRMDLVEHQIENLEDQDDITPSSYT